MDRPNASPKTETHSEAGDELAAEYQRVLRLHIVSLLEEAPLSLCQVVRRAGGAFPTEAQDALANLVASGEIVESEGHYSLRDPGGRSAPFADSFLQGIVSDSQEQETRCRPERKRRVFADPHPMDYDWRFTWASLAKLARALNTPVKRGARIASLGAPSLYLFLARQGRHVTLFDRSRSLIRDLQASGFTDGLIEHDLFYPIPDRRLVFDIVVADPPWYPEFHRAFILRSSELLTDQGIMLLSVLPWLTRPTATRDRAELLSFANRAGFDLILAVPSFLNYETPTFEQAALSQRGIRCGNWRRGDMYVFRRVRPSMQVSAECPTVTESIWDEFRFGTSKVKLRRRGEKDTRRFAARTVGGDAPVLSTVSRRWPLRSAIDLWTSGNAAYSVEGLEPLRAALKMLEQEQDPELTARRVAQDHSLEAEDEQRLVDFLRQLKRQIIES